MTKSVIITMPCMGKTTLCKNFRDEEWRFSPFVDLDYKGVSSYSDRTREANSRLAIALLSSNEHDAIMGFDGQFDLDILIEAGIQLLFFMPIGACLDSLPGRSYKRNDSKSFTRLYEENKFVWAHNLYKSYIRALSGFWPVEDGETFKPRMFMVTWATNYISECFHYDADHSVKLELPEGFVEFDHSFSDHLSIAKCLELLATSGYYM